MVKITSNYYCIAMYHLIAYLPVITLYSNLVSLQAFSRTSLKNYEKRMYLLQHELHCQIISYCIYSYNCLKFCASKYEALREKYFEIYP